MRTMRVDQDNRDGQGGGFCMLWSYMTITTIMKSPFKSSADSLDKEVP